MDMTIPELLGFMKNTEYIYKKYEGAK